MSAGQKTDVEILLVEDHADTEAALLHLLTQEGYSVLTASSGQQALDVLDRGVRPRLILLDLVLPRVSGWEVLDVLHTDIELRRIPIVVMTGARKEQVHVVADAVLRKPLDFDTLLSTIRDLMKKKI